MPICTTCTHPAEYLYTTYESEHNLRLEECVCRVASVLPRKLTTSQTNCKAFVDPFVEFDELMLFIDLILLKRGVYRHLLYNRGTEPRRAAETPEERKRSIELTDRREHVSMTSALNVSLVSNCGSETLEHPCEAWPRPHLLRLM